MKKILTILTTMISFCVISAQATPICSDWAIDYIETANTYGIIGSKYLSENLANPISRYDTASVMSSTYKNINETSYSTDGTFSNFTDIYGSFDPQEIMFVVENQIMIGNSEQTFNPSGELTRQEFSKIITTLVSYYNDVEFQVENFDDCDFSDWASVSDWAKPYVSFASENGYLQGYANGNFGPNDKVSYEQVYIVLSRALELKTYTKPTISGYTDQQIIPSGTDIKINTEPNTTAFLNLSNDVFYTYNSDSNNQITIPYNLLQSGKKITIALSENNVFSNNLTLYVDKKETSFSGFIDYDTNVINLIIDTYDDDKIFNLSVVENRTNRYSSHIPAREKLNVSIKGSQTYTFQTDLYRNYEITLSDGLETQNLFAQTASLSRDYTLINAISNYQQFPSQSEAKSAMTDISVPVWQIKNGEKVSSSLTITVRTALAPTFAKIFNEIYNGSEKFPIKDAGAFSWRGSSSTSTHNLGIGIDINANENACYYANGTVVGSYWKPYEDPYSITPYGDVVRAFENNGFCWGGDAWGANSPRDYMHFDYRD